MVARFETQTHSAIFRSFSPSRSSLFAFRIGEFVYSITLSFSGSDVLKVNRREMIGKIFKRLLLLFFFFFFF